MNEELTIIFGGWCLTGSRECSCRVEGVWADEQCLMSALGLFQSGIKVTKYECRAFTYVGAKAILHSMVVRVLLVIKRALLLRGEPWAGRSDAVSVEESNRHRSLQGDRHKPGGNWVNVHYIFGHSRTDNNSNSCFEQGQYWEQWTTRF